MSIERADVHDAELILKLYDLRREPLMREARGYMTGSFLPQSYEEFIGHTQPQHPHNAHFRQVNSYWEMAYSFARHGVMNAELLAENAGEGILIFAKVERFISQYRAEVAPSAYLNAEWITANSKIGKQKLDSFRKRFQ